MILEIRMSNFFSIKEEVVLDFRAGSINTKQSKELNANTFQSAKQTILKTIAIYGANASGKSNILKAFFICRNLIVWSHTFNENVTFAFKPFKFHEYPNRPSSFSIRFLLDGIEYEYGFTLTTTEFLSEWLWHYPKGKRAKIFTRQEDPSAEKNEIYSFSPSLLKRPMDVAESTSGKTLYLSRGSQMDRDLLQRVYRYFAENFVTGDINELLQRLFRTVNRQEIIDALAIADSDISGVYVEFKEVPTKNINYNVVTDQAIVDEINQTQMIFTSFHKENPKIPFDFFTEESDGTRSLFFHLINALDAIKHNHVVFIDEIEKSLHPKIVDYLIHLFHSSKSAQLVFTTHNTHLLDLKKFRKDQIYFVNKKEDSSTDLYSLYDYSDFRDTMDLEKAYLQGRFDAVPYIDDTPESIKSVLNEQTA